MTLLHYACKAGAHGVGDPAAAVRLSTRLLALGGDVTLRSRWTHMNALHYAAYFDVPELIRTLLRAAAPRGAGTGWGGPVPWGRTLGSPGGRTGGGGGGGGLLAIGQWGLRGKDVGVPGV
ncbi:CAP-Gly domain-containing linker protein 3-like [Oxyura jamaicensis]|uniref:CAP-Gly domain-containing linker protein 3-like n=1 Tax=Oxyura jamaicensis TaxID=8884 RepID=UPI0015A5A374|nr:CAP-Gly domain-containing linker protein 3-like [Oxyura jamaicensis]